jgi:hypothetical protein
MTPLNRFVRIAVSTALCGVLVVVAVRAQGQAEAGAGSLAGLTREIQLLRQAVEESTRSQSHSQMLSVALSAQQSRLMQVANRLDATRRDLAEAIQQAADSRRLLTMFQSDQSTPEDREEAASLMKMFKPQADAAAQREQQLRAREAELIQVHQAEEARWTDLVARLEQSVKR